MPKLTEALRSKLEGRCYETIAEFQELQRQHIISGFHNRPRLDETLDDANTAADRGMLVLPHRPRKNSTRLEVVYRAAAMSVNKPMIVVKLRPDGCGDVKWELPEGEAAAIIRNKTPECFRRCGQDRLWRLNLLYDRMELDDKACREFTKKLRTDALWVGGDTMGRAGFTNGYQQIVTAVVLSCQDMMNEADQKAN